MRFEGMCITQYELKKGGLKIINLNTYSFYEIYALILICDISLTKLNNYGFNKP